MKPRIIIAAVLALLIHGVLLNAKFLPLSQTVNMFPSTNIMQMTFSSPNKIPNESKIKKTDLKSNKKKNKNVSFQNRSDKENENFKNTDSYESISVVHKARPLDISNKPPSYPRVAQIRGYQGTVVLRVLVNTNGTVSKLNILKSSGYWMLDNAALTAIKDWVFEPGYEGKKKVDMWVEQPIRFQLK